MIFSLSLYKCWASKDVKASTAGESTLTDTLTTTTDTALVSNDGDILHFFNHLFRNFNSGMNSVHYTTGSHQNLELLLEMVI